MKISILAALVWLAAIVPARAGDPFEGRPITAVSVQGLKHVHETIVLEQIESRPGTVYSHDAIARDLVRLDRLNVFSDVTIDPSADGAGVRLAVVVVETLRVMPAVSVAVTSESGVSIGPAIKVLSLGGHPQELSLTTRFGGQSMFQASEYSPFLTYGRIWHSASVSVGTRTNELDHFEEKSVDFDGRVGVRGSEKWNVGAIVQFYGVRSDTAGITLSTDNRDAFPGFGAVYELDSRDSWKTPTRGWWNTVDAIWHTGAGTYTTLDVDVRRYQPLTPRQTLVATALVTVQSGERGVDIPTYTDYALGGVNTIRGWDFAARRGKNQAISTVEYRRTLVRTQAFHVMGLDLYGGIALAAFVDAGSAWSASADFSRNAIAGGGIGLRLYCPYIDMIRLDFAIGDRSQLLVGIGEKAVTQRNRIR